ncbi:MAG: zinc-dependent metalloprotease [Planctomycetota bacterium]
MRLLLVAAALLFFVLTPHCVAYQDEKPAEKEKEKKPIPTIDSFLEGKQRTAGYIPFIWDPAKGKIYLQITRPGEEFLYVHSLATGLGSNPVGLDRGQLGDQKVVRFKRVGPKVLLIQRNLRFRALTDNPLERRAVEQSFAQSVLWGGEIVAENNDQFIIDISDLLLSDVHGVVETLKRTDQGDFALDYKRSAVFLDRCKSFPKNTELEVTLTFSSSKPGNLVRQTAPTAKAVSLRQHHSFIKLPDANYQPRAYDVRCPSIFITFADYASPLDQPLEQRWITRHRLQKQDPQANLSKPIEPIIYYVDAGAPKQIQEALVEGASWWNEAFESAGFQDAFQVKLLPPEADPLDVRYNVIQWVHRSTRGWSYGGSVIDPRTGEIIKGHVTLGSLRVRQDQLLVNSLKGHSPNIRCSCCGVGGIAEEATLADLAAGADALEVSLARIRQLSAHEVGHTLGFVHNFAASTYGDRASVMDYPAPRVTINGNQQLDLSDAYAVGIGAWDKIAAQFAYTQFAEDQDEQSGLQAILKTANDAGMLFMSDADARPAGAAHPLANLWDNGSDPLEELQHVMKVRRIALDRFDPTQLPAGTSTGEIGQFLTPVYLHHRYQLQAAGKLIGGYRYQYGYVGQTNSGNAPIEGEVQKRCIDAILQTIAPQQLLIRRELLQSISPRPYASIRDQEILPSRSGRIFDPLAAAKVAADLALDELFQHQRLNRLSHPSAEDTPDVSYLVNRVVESTWQADLRAEGQTQRIAQIVCEAVVDHLINLADRPDAGTEVRAVALAGLRGILSRIDADNRENAFNEMMNRRIKLFLDRPYSVIPDSRPLVVPPGSPIGASR